MYISRSIVISLLVLLAPAVYAQKKMASKQQPQQSRHLSKEEQEALRRKEIDDSIPFFRGVQVKVDAIGLVQKAVSDYGQYEAGVRVNLKDKYFPVVEFGLGKADHREVTTAISYHTSAPYAKIGMDFNIMKNKHDIYRAYIGARLAGTSFKYDLDNPAIIDPVYGGNYPVHEQGVKAKYTWMEALAGIDAKIYGPIHLGWSVRYYRRLSHDDGALGNVWYVPGFGKQASTRIGGTFDIIVEL